jgi:hypothetical protein
MRGRYGNYSGYRKPSRRHIQLVNRGNGIEYYGKPNGNDNVHGDVYIEWL